MRKITMLLTLLVLLVSTASAYNNLDGKITVDDAHNLSYVAIFLFVASFAAGIMARGVSALSIILMMLAAIMMFHVSEVYINGTMIQIMPNSTIEIITNGATSQFWQLFALLSSGIFALEAIILMLAKKKPIFVADEKFGDGLE